MFIEGAVLKALYRTPFGDFDYGNLVRSCGCWFPDGSNGEVFAQLSSDGFGDYCFEVMGKEEALDRLTENLSFGPEWARMT